MKIKKQNPQKSFIKRKIKFQNCKNGLEVTRFNNEKNYLEKIKLV